MPRKTKDVEKHNTGRSSATEDFVKHDCPNKITVWKNGKAETHSVQVKREFNAIRGNEEMVPVNCMAADSCGICGMSVDDPLMIACTTEDVEALRK